MSLSPDFKRARALESVVSGEVESSFIAGEGSRAGSSEVTVFEVVRLSGTGGFCSESHRTEPVDRSVIEPTPNKTLPIGPSD